MQGSLAYKSPNNYRNWSKGSPLLGDSLAKSGNFCHFNSLAGLACQVRASAVLWKPALLRLFTCNKNDVTVTRFG